MADITFAAEDFKYPSSEEKKKAYEHFPKIQNFNFPYQKDMELLWSGKKTFAETTILTNLFWWDLILGNKIGKLGNVFVNVFVNYDRAFRSDAMRKAAEVALDRFQFNFYIETFYYYYFSARDIVFQIVNLYYNLELDEKNVSQRKLLEKLEQDNAKRNLIEVAALIRQFDAEIKLSIDIRNSFTHRFPINTPDNRSKIVVNLGGGTEYHGGTGDFMKPREIMENINISVSKLADLVHELKDLMPIEE